MDFLYLEVAPGHGYYTWFDYNENNIKELDEFEPAHFKDQASYIRVFRPGTEYVPVYTSRVNQTINFLPGQWFKNNAQLSRILSRFSNNLAYTADRRSYQQDFLANLNPISSSIADSLIVSLNQRLRNSLSFSSKSGKTGVDYLYQQSETKVLMTYGTDQIQSESHTLILKWKPTGMIWVQDRVEKGQKKYNSGFFTSKNYEIDFIQNHLEMSAELFDRVRSSTVWETSYENNTSGTESSLQNRFEAGVDYSWPGLGQLHMDAQYIRIRFNGTPGTPIAYVMLKGFLPGNNGLINLGIRRKLNDLIRLDFSYGARISEGQGIIHTGNIQIRAIF